MKKQRAYYKYLVCGRVIGSNYALELPKASSNRPSFIDLNISWVAKIKKPKVKLKATNTEGIFVFGHKLHFVWPKLAVGYFDGHICQLQFLKPFRYTPESQVSLLHHILPYLLAYKGDLLFHASSVGTKESAVAFIGLSGRGKSTTAALLTEKHGLSLLGDEYIRISEYRGRIRIHPSLPELRLDHKIKTKVTAAKSEKVWGKERLRYDKGFTTKSRCLKKLFLIDGRSSLSLTQKMLENAYFCSAENKKAMKKHFQLISKTISQYEPIELPPQRSIKQFRSIAKQVQLALS